MTDKHNQPTSTLRFCLIAAGCILATALTGCGGGTATSDPVLGALTIADAVGNYSTGCAIRPGAGSEYKVITGTFSDKGNGVGQAVIRYMAYGSDANCNPASLKFDVSATLEVRPSADTKSINNATTAHSFVGTANTAQVTLLGLTLSKGSFSGNLPTFGASSKVGYIRVKTDLLFVAGNRRSDGLGDYISNVALKKLP